MRKLFSMRVELTVLRTLCLEPESRAAQDLLAKIDASYFATEVGRSAFKRCQVSLRKKSELPDWDDLITDPNLDETIRDVLEECDYEPLTSKKRTRKAIERLGDYKKLRLLTKLGSQIEKTINSTDPINVDEKVLEAQNVLSEARSSKNFRVLRIGRNSNARKYVEKVLKGEAVQYIPTGFAGFDSINRGFSRGAYCLLAAPTGAGKSAMANVLSENMAMSGAHVGVVPLEMENIEMLQRNIARLSKTDMTKLLDPQQRLSKRERRDILESFTRYDKKIERVGGSLEFYEFDEDITIENLTATVQPYGLDALVIDYLGLLDETSGEDQWRALGRVARYLHIWGKANGITTVGLAQLSEEGLLRYSKQMAEHAKYFWYWQRSEISKSTGIYEITQGKARQASDHTFLLKFHPATMTWTDADKAEIDDYTNSRKDSKVGREKSSGAKKKWKEDSSIGWGDEDEPEPVPGRNAQGHVKKKKGRGKPPSRKDVEL